MKNKRSTGTGSEQGRRSEWKKNRFLFLMLVPGLIVLFFNNYLPMAGIVMALAGTVLVFVTVTKKDTENCGKLTKTL